MSYKIPILFFQSNGKIVISGPDLPKTDIKIKGLCKCYTVNNNLCKN